MCGEGQVGIQHCKHLLRRGRQTLGAEVFFIHFIQKTISERLGSTPTSFHINVVFKGFLRPNSGIIKVSPKISPCSLSQPII
jgi:hypothetical protein